MMWKLVGSAAAVGIGCLLVSNFASAGLARAMTPVQRRLQVMTRDCVPDDVLVDVPDCAPDDAPDDVPDDVPNCAPDDVRVRLQECRDERGELVAEIVRAISVIKVYGAEAAWGERP